MESKRSTTYSESSSCRGAFGGIFMYKLFPVLLPRLPNNELELGRCRSSPSSSSPTFTFSVANSTFLFPSSLSIFKHLFDLFFFHCRFFCTLLSTLQVLHPQFQSVALSSYPLLNSRLQTYSYIAFTRRRTMRLPDKRLPD